MHGYTSTPTVIQNSEQFRHLAHAHPTVATLMRALRRTTEVWSAFRVEHKCDPAKVYVEVTTQFKLHESKSGFKKGERDDSQMNVPVLSIPALSLTFSREQINNNRYQWKPRVRFDECTQIRRCSPRPSSSRRTSCSAQHGNQRQSLRVSREVPKRTIYIYI